MVLGLHPVLCGASPERPWGIQSFPLSPSCLLRTFLIPTLCHQVPQTCNLWYPMLPPIFRVLSGRVQGIVEET